MSEYGNINTFSTSKLENYILKTSELIQKGEPPERIESKQINDINISRINFPLVDRVQLPPIKTLFELCSNDFIIHKNSRMNL